MFEGNAVLGLKDNAKVLERIERPKIIMVIVVIKVNIKLFSAKKIKNTSCLFNVL